MSGSRVDIPDKELAQEWPFLTRQQVQAGTLHKNMRYEAVPSLQKADFALLLLACMHTLLCKHVPHTA